MKIFISLLLLFGTVASSAANSFAVGLELAVGGWNQNPDGQFAYESLLPQDRVDLERDAGYTDQDRFTGRLNIDLPLLPSVYFMGTMMEFEGNGAKNFTFGDAAITGDFYSKIKFDHYDLALYYGVPLTGLVTLGTVGIDFGLNVRKLDIELAASDQSSPSVSDSTAEIIYLPMGFLALQIEPTEDLAFEFEFRGVSYSDSSYYDVIGRLKLRFAGVAFAAAGWRHEVFDLNEKNIVADVTVSGPFLEAGLQF